jgi:hypothetical protein
MRCSGVQMAKWDYAGDGGTIYPVRVGDIWRCGDAKIQCCDLEHPSTRASLMSLGKWDLVYVDPPWNAGNARSFRTKAGVDGEKGHAVDFSGLLDRLFSFSTGVPFFMEMGNKSIELMQERATAARLKFVRTWPVTYYHKYPHTLVYLESGNSHLDSRNMPDFTGMDDDDTPELAINTFTRMGQTVCDPCTGRGLIPQWALQMGRKFVGNELNPYRISVTLRKLNELTGLKPECIGKAY